MREGVIAFLLLIPLWALSHGEDRLGPRGGYIRMPGSYHTELVLLPSGKVQIYLLDMDWKNPTLKDSSVVLKLNTKQRIEEAKCARLEKTQAFECRFDQPVSHKTVGELTLTSARAGLKGIEARYSLPLSLHAQGH